MGTVEISVTTFIIGFITLLAITLGVMVVVPWVEARRQLNKRILGVFGVPRRGLGHMWAEDVVRGLVFEAGILMVSEEVLQGQLDPRCLSAYVDTVEDTVTRYKFHSDLGAEIGAATRKVKQGDDLAAQVGISLRLPRTAEGLVDIASMSPYNMARSARERTSREKRVKEGRARARR